TFPLPKRPVTTVKVEVFDAQQPDVQPSTNFMQVNIKPPDLRMADMQIVEVKAEDEKGKGGFLVRLRNNGPARILPSRLKVELEIYGDIIARSEKRVERLDSSGEVETRVQIPNAPVIPSTNGLLYLRWNSEEVQDSEPSNNVYKLPVPLVLRMPDLIPVKPTIDRQGVLNFRVQNKGKVRAAASVTALYINGALVERYNTPAIGPRGSSQYRYKAMKLSPEDKIVIVTDFNADVQESSEENNRLNEPSS
ncbi:MAG: CARDB domain-containing protein, partial [Acidobacteriota bacterium]